MSDIKAIIGFIGLFVAIFGLFWTIKRDTRKRPMVVVTRDKAPASEAELIANDGAQFAISPQTGVVQPPSNYVGTLFIVRNLQNRKELARFTLKAGHNEVNI